MKGNSGNCRAHGAPRDQPDLSLYPSRSLDITDNDCTSCTSSA